MINPNEDKSVDTTKYNRRLMGNVVRLPMVVGPALGTTMVDVESGRAMLDFWGDEGVCSLGYGDEVNARMATFASLRVPHQLPDVYPHEIRYQAAEIICDRTGFDRIFFCNSGTEANEAMIKLARKYAWDKEGCSQGEIAHRHRVLTVEGNFHGRTGLSLACTDPRVSPYHRWGFGPFAKGFGVIDFDGYEFHVSMLDGENLSEQESEDFDWSTVAAINLAPVLGNNLVKTYPKAFWNALTRLREEHGLLIMFDDVQAGNGRAGYHATYQHPDVGLKPDIMALGKGMALGFPVACILASEEISESFTPGVHFNTFGGSPFVCYMATEYYKWLDENLGDVRKKGEAIRDALSRKTWVAEVDGAGMLNAFRPNYEKYGYDGFDFCHAARQAGLSIVTHRQFGPIRFTPPMNVSEGDLALALTILDMVHDYLTGQIRKVRVMGTEMFIVDRRDDKNQRARIRDNAPHSHYAIGRNDIATELAAFDEICRFISGVGTTSGGVNCGSVLELFGGSGWHSMLIQRHLEPELHKAWDVSKDCVDSITKSLKWVDAEQVGDSLKALASAPHDLYDWVHADFNLLDVEKAADLGLHDLFHVAKKLVTVTDTTPSSEAKDTMGLAYYLEGVAGGEWTRVATYDWGPAQMHVFQKEAPVSEAALVKCTDRAEIEVLT